MRSLFFSPTFLIRLLLPAVLLPASCFAAIDASPELPAPTINVKDEGGTLQLSISLRVPVSPREAWDVLTDFEHMADFVPNIDSSQVLARTSKTLQIEQKGSISLGMIPIHYESKRQIELTPYRMIRSHALSGNTRLDSVMVLTPVGKDTLLAYRATAIPDLPVPNSMVSSYMGDMLENQFKAMGREMIKRMQAGDNIDGDDDADTQLAQLAATQAVQKTPQQAAKPAAATKPLTTKTATTKKATTKTITTRTVTAKTAPAKTVTSKPVTTK